VWSLSSRVSVPSVCQRVCCLNDASNVAAAEFLEEGYRLFHHERFIHPDPLEVVRNYSDPQDREIAAFMCSCLALGRVNAILGIIGKVLSLFPDLRSDLMSVSDAGLRRKLDGIVYRFFTGDMIANLLSGLRNVIGQDGSLNAAFLAGLGDEADLYPSIDRFAARLRAAVPGKVGMLIPESRGNGAAKRVNLFLRWMVRKDAIDPGGWTGISPARLIIPLDTHVGRVSRDLGLTSRKSNDRRTALEITGSLKRLDPEDPVRFDFSMARPGINPAAVRIGTAANQ